jgi:hypothetical protein
MRFTIRFAVLLIAALSTLSIKLPAWYRGPYPHPAGPTFHNDVSRLYRREIERRQPEFVLLGDSTLGMGVEEAMFQELVGAPAYKLDFAGSTTALWYVFVKTNIAHTNPPPPYLIILFRDSLLTSPTFRVNGKYFEKIDVFASPKDRVVVERAYLAQLSPVQIFFEKYFPLYTYRSDVQETTKALARHTLPLLFGCNASCADRSMNAVLRDVQPDLLDQSIIQIDQGNLYTREQLDFSSQVDKSFLPEIIRLAKENGIQLILVRTPNNIFPEPGSEPDGLKKYITDLNDYLAEREIHMLDLSRVEGIGPAQFTDPYHMNKEGASVFTRILADAIKDLLEQDNTGTYDRQ